MYVSRFLSPLLAASGLLLAAASGPVAAQTIAFGFTSDAVANSFEDSASDFGATAYNLGYTFTANQNISVTQLGWFFDPGFTSFVTGTPAPNALHEVGLFTSSGTLLASTEVSYTGGGQGFSYMPLLFDIPLTAGTTYVLAGNTGTDDPFVYDVQDPNQPGDIGLTEAPAVTYDADRDDTTTNTLAVAYPADSDGPLVDPAYFGPNFQFIPTPAATSVPEASPFALLGLGMVPLAWAARRRKIVP